MPEALPPDVVDALRQMFVKDRKRLDDQTAVIERELASIIESTDRANIDDEHDPEGPTIAYERSLTISRLAAARRTRSELDQAADRLDRGTYGYCRGCGDLIAVERLIALPTTSTCVGCADP